jgi:hypothetical protein
MYPWPFGEFDSVMDDALNIAMDYLIRTGQAVKFREAQEVAAEAIAVAWRLGVMARARERVDPTQQRCHTGRHAALFISRKPRQVFRRLH